MGGRLTEMFDFLNREEKLTLTELNALYFSFSVEHEEMLVRKRLRREKKSRRKIFADAGDRHAQHKE